VNLNKLVKAALSTGLYLLEQSDKATARMRERVKDRINDQIEDLTDRAREAFSPEDHTLRNVLSLAAGVGAGVAIGMLCAPAKGEELRSSIAGKVQGASSKFRQRFSSEERAATGTTG
jgi:gas vesicle protein